MKQISEVLGEVMERHGFPYGVVASSTGEVLAEHGAPEALVSRGLRTTLFGDSEAIIRLYESLDGQVLPRIWSQGDLKCAVFRPLDKVVLGLFDQSGRSIVVLHSEFKQVAQELADALSLRD